MGRRLVLPVTLTIALLLPLTAAVVGAKLDARLNDLVRSAIENINLEAGDLVAATGLRYSPVKNLVRIDLDLTPISLQKRPGRIELVDWTTIRAMAAFEFIGRYDLRINNRSVKSNEIKLVGEGAVNISFKGLKIKIEDIPSLVLKLADRQGECPDIGQIKRNPRSVPPGGSYQVATNLKSNSPGHVAYFIFANNKAAVSAQPTLQTVLPKEVDYTASLAVRPDASPDNYFGNVMAVEIVSKSKNPLDFESYDVLFTTGITMISVK